MRLVRAEEGRQPGTPLSSRLSFQVPEATWSSLAWRPPPCTRREKSRARPARHPRRGGRTLTNHDSRDSGGLDGPSAPSSHACRRVSSLNRCVALGPSRPVSGSRHPLKTGHSGGCPYRSIGKAWRVTLMGPGRANVTGQSALQPKQGPVAVRRARREQVLAPPTMQGLGPPRTPASSRPPCPPHGS